jgi:hypothetical protein
MYCCNKSKKGFIKEMKNVFNDNIREDQLILRVFFQDCNFLLLMAYYADEKDCFDVVIVKDFITHHSNLLEFVSYYLADDDLETKTEFINDIIDQTLAIGRSLNIPLSLGIRTDGTEDVHLEWELLPDQSN